MLQRSSVKFPPLPYNTPVQIAVPKEDRSTLSDRNLLGVILCEKHTGVYQVGTKEGTLSRLIFRQNLKPMSVRVIDAADVPSNLLTLRKNAAIVNMTGGKGYIHCKCKTLCRNNSCSCRRGNYKCSSHCHHSTSCCNKA